MYDLNQKLKENMYQALYSLDNSIPDNKQLRLLSRNKNNISLSPLKEQPEPGNINKMWSYYLWRDKSVKPLCSNFNKWKE